MWLYKQLCKIWQFFAMINDKLFRKNADFSGWLTQNEAGFAEQEGNKYQPCTDTLKKVLKHFPITGTDNILDIGCGKGKAMYIMSKFPFGKICGYDLSNQLVQIANKNFEKLNLEQCQAFCANALHFDNYDDFTYFYIFNSFPQEIFEVMMTNIVNSIKRNPRKCRFIYLNPVCDKYILENTPFKLVYKKRAFISWFTYHCYETIE